MIKNGFLFFVGLLVAFIVGWGGIALGSHKQLGALAPYFDKGEETAFPARPPGVAARGQLVYADLGCAACHTQQVRRPDFGSDKARGWGERQSVARDYIFQIRPQLGSLRVGPDLTNLAGRKPTAPVADDLYKLLYTGSANHPAYKFLFEERKIDGQLSENALALSGVQAPPAGRQIVSTERAQTLVAYLLSLNTPYEFPEARPVVTAVAAKEGAPK